MSSAAPKFFLTTPIYYVNARPHIGHAYTTIAADVLARHHHLQGDATFFITGTDEHGQKIERSAAAAGIPPQQFADQVSHEFRTLWDRMGLTYDKFIRTTDEAHKRGVQKLWRTLESRGHIYLDSYTGAYCVSDEAFVDVPAGAPCPDCGRPTEIVTEENYFFRLSAFQQPVLDLIESGALVIEPEARRNEVLSFLRGGLKDLSISRSSFTWGIPVPTDHLPLTTDHSHVIYVWLDALANYMTALGYGSDDESLWEKYWPADLHIVGKEIIRFHCVYWPAFLLAAGLPTPKKIVAHGWLLFEESKMSKSRGNIVRTETILDAFGALCPPPPPTPTPNSVILSEARSAQSKDPDAARPATADNSTPPQISALAAAPTIIQPAESLKGRGFSPAVIAPAEPAALAAEGISRHDRDLFAADVLRYFLLREIPFGQDGSFSFDALVTRYNADLANGYGNLVSRVLKMIQANFDGFIPLDTNLALAESPEELARIAQEGAAAQVVQHVNRCVTISRDETLGTMFNVLLGEMNLAVTITDRYISENTPWKLAKTPGIEARTKLTDVLATAAESIRIITLLLHPILPYATASVWRQLGLGDITERTTDNGQRSTSWGGLAPGTRLGPLSPIFPRADKKLIEIMTQMEQDKNTPIAHANAQHDASPEPRSEFPEAPIASEESVRSVESVSSLSPAAPPRTSTLAEPNPGAQVAASTAITTERDPTPLTTDHVSLATPTISIDDFAKIELRVAKILVAERIPKADKLLRLEVDLGYETRQILSGIAEHYTPEELIGRRIVVITNLAPRKMRGLESHGMLLAASDGDHGKPVLATFPDSDDIPLGSRLK